MAKRILITITTLIVGVWLAKLVSEGIVITDPVFNRVQEILKHHIDGDDIPSIIVVETESILTSDASRRFYQNRTYRPAWSDDHGPLLQVDALIESIHQAVGEGLRPSDYYLDTIELVLAQIRQGRSERAHIKPNELAELDLLLTHAFLTYGAHLLNGRHNPGTADAEWISIHTLFSRQ